MSAIVKQQEESHDLSNQTTSTSSTGTPPTPLFAPSEQNQQSIGSSLGSYALAGAGMAMGFALVRLVVGV